MLEEASLHLFGKAIIAQDKARIASAQVEDMPDLFGREHEEMCHEEKDKGLFSPKRVVSHEG